MLFILGSLSLIQILFLPGMILLKLFKFRRGVIQTLVSAFGLSLIFNFLWVLLLTLLKINFPVLHYILFIIELGLFAWLYRESLLLRSEELAASILAWTNRWVESAKALFPEKEGESALSRLVKILVTAVFFIWALAGIFWLARLMINEFGTAFKLWDAVVSWNKWGAFLSNNTIVIMGRYPQLVPANFSVTYSFMGSTEIQFFAKGFMPLFTLFTWLLLLDLAFEFKQPGIFIGMVILRYMTKKHMGPYLAEGYVDLALLFFTFLTVYTLLKASRTEEGRSRNEILLLGGVFAAGTALTKQNGLLMFAFYPLLALLLLEEDLPSPLIERIKKLIKPVAIGLALLIPWYLMNEIRIRMGLNEPNIDILTGADLHGGRTYLERAIRGFDSLGIYQVLLPLALISLPLIEKNFRRVAYLMVFPYTILWLFLFSYAVRNLAMVFPFLAITVGMGLYRLMEISLGWGEKIKLPALRTVFYLIPIFLLVIGAGQILTDEKLTAMQIEDQKSALLPNLNHRLYDLFAEEGAAGPIMTQYPLEFLPELGDYKISEPFTIYKEFYQNFSAHPEARYFLVWDQYAKGEVTDQIAVFEEVGAIEFLFKEYNLKLYRVLDRETILAHPPVE
ncbi:MAG: hypothetical protein ACK2T7_12945 [Anaerolineales bacterium]